MEPIDVGNIKSERMTPSMEVLTIDEDVEVIEVDSEGTPSTQQSQPAASGSSVGPALDVRIKTEEPSAMFQDSLVSHNYVRWDCSHSADIFYLDNAVRGLVNQTFLRHG